MCDIHGGTLKVSQGAAFQKEDNMIREEIRAGIAAATEANKGQGRLAGAC